MSSIQAGDLAPDFIAQAHNGRQVSLADLRGKHVVVLYFYPKDGTPVCTKEALEMVQKLAVESPGPAGVS